MHCMWRKWQNCIMSISYVELLWLCAMFQLSWKYTSWNPLPRYVSCWLQRLCTWNLESRSVAAAIVFNLKVGAGHTVGPVRVAADVSSPCWCGPARPEALSPPTISSFTLSKSWASPAGHPPHQNWSWWEVNADCNVLVLTHIHLPFPTV